MALTMTDVKNYVRDVRIEHDARIAESISAGGGGSSGGNGSGSDFSGALIKAGNATISGLDKVITGTTRFTGAVSLNGAIFEGTGAKFTGNVKAQGHTINLSPYTEYDDSMNLTLSASTNINAAESKVTLNNATIYGNTQFEDKIVFNDKVYMEGNNVYMTGSNVLLGYEERTSVNPATGERENTGSINKATIKAQGAVVDLSRASATNAESITSYYPAQIDMPYAVVDMNRASVKANGLTLTAGNYVSSITCDIPVGFQENVTIGGKMYFDAVSGRDAHIYAQEQKIHIGNSTLYGNSRFEGATRFASISGSPIFTGTPTFQNGAAGLSGGDFVLTNKELDMTGSTIIGSPRLSGTLRAGSIEAGFGSSSIKAGNAYIAVNGASIHTDSGTQIDGNLIFTGTPTFQNGANGISGGGTIDFANDFRNKEIDFQGSSLMASGTLIDATSSSTTTLKANIRVEGNILSSADIGFNGKTGLYGPVDATFTSISLNGSSINGGASGITFENGTSLHGDITFTGKPTLANGINIHGGTLSAGNAILGFGSTEIRANNSAISLSGASISGSPIFTGTPTFQNGANGLSSGGAVDFTNKTTDMTGATLAGGVAFSTALILPTVSSTVDGAIWITT